MRVPLVTSSPVTRARDRAARAAVEVRLEGLSRPSGPVVALDRLDLTLEPGQLVAPLGPPGCGKTTTLRLLAGLEDADDGRGIVAGPDITHVPATTRGTGLAFPAHSPFPPLPGPPSAAVPRAGHLEQIASPTEVYSRPATSFVAEFVGLTNRLVGEVRAGQLTVRGRVLPLVERETPDGQVVALVRPEAVTLASHDAPESGPLVGTVIAVTFLGATSRVTVDLGDTTVLAQLTTADATALPAGSRVALTIRPDPVLVSASSDPAVPMAEDEA